MKQSKIDGLIDFIKISIINELTKKILLRLIRESQGLTERVYCQLSNANGFNFDEITTIFADLGPLSMHFLIRKFLLGMGTDFTLQTESRNGFIWLTNSTESIGRLVTFTRADLDDQTI